MTIADIKASPIKSVTIGHDNDLQIDIAAPNIMKESNYTVDPVTVKTDRGGEIGVGFKVNISVYFITNSKIDRDKLKELLKKTDLSCVVNFGGVGFSSINDSAVFFTSSRSISLKLKEETTQGFLRYNLIISGIVRNLPSIAT